MASEDGENFIKNLAQFVRTHEKALANALQLRRQGGAQKLASSSSSDASPTQITSFQNSTISSSTSSALAAAFSLGALSFTSHNIKPAKLTLTPHHLFYLLSRFEELGIVVGPMNVRLESLRTEQSPTNYVSFLSHHQQGSKARSDRDSIHSVSSVRSAMSGISSLWSSFGIGSSDSAAKTEKAKAQLEADIKYLYSAFTKIPCLRLSPDRRARLIGGYEEFPFDTAVPLLAFKNVSALEIYDVDFRQFFGWDRLADQLRSLTVKRAHVEDPADLLSGIVLDDMDRRRRRSSKTQSSPMSTWPASPGVRHPEFARGNSAPGSLIIDDSSGRSSSPRNSQYVRGDVEVSNSQAHARTKSSSPTRPSSSRQNTSYRHNRGSGAKVKRSGSGSSNSSTHSVTSPARNRSSSNLISMNILPASKWRFLKHLSLADNSLTSLTTSSLSPLANSLHSLDLTSNLFSEVPDSLASLTALRALNLSNCMIDSLHSLARNPLPAIVALNLRSNRLASLAGIEKLLSLERLDLRDNKLSDPTETARLTGIPDIREIWVLSNPFVKSHSSYRITIFNLFRGTPGYTEDIVIDATSPGFTERRQLRERIAETEAVPIVSPMHIEPDKYSFSHLDVLASYNTTPPDERQTRPTPRVTQSEANVNSGRRKKAVKRRIVDLSIDEDQTETIAQHSLIRSESKLKSAPAAITDVNGTAAIKGYETSRKTQLAFPLQGEDRPTSFLQPSSTYSDTVSPEVPLTSPDVQLPAESGKLLEDQLHHQHFNAEAYRRKVEALKDEFGHTWLNVLSHEKWEGQRQEQETPNSHFAPLSPVRPNISDLRAASQGIISGSRTLG